MEYRTSDDLEPWQKKLMLYEMTEDSVAYEVKLLN